MGKSLLWLLNVLLMLTLSAGAAGDDNRPRSPPGPSVQRQGDDLMVFGGTVSLHEAVPGDLIVGGGSVDVDAAVTGDALAFGGKVRLGQDVAGSVLGLGGQLTVSGKVGRNVRAAGGQLEFGPKSEVAGNVTAAGGQLRLSGAVKGIVYIAGGRVVIDGPVGGDVVATAGQLELGPKARIGGVLRYRSHEPLLQDAAAQVLGGIEAAAMPMGSGQTGSAARQDEDHRGFAGAWIGMWTLGLLLAGVLLAALPGPCAAVSRTLRERPGASLLLGFAGLVCVPVAAVLLIATLVGIPAGLLLLALYAAVLPLAYVGAGIGLGQWALTRWWPARAGGLPIRMAASALALVGLSLLGWVPVLGALAGFLALLVGLGALLLQLKRSPAPASANVNVTA